MAITAYDLKRATLDEGSEEYEIHYCFKSAQELGVLTTLTTLQHLNVSFNQLGHVRGIQHLQSLQCLNLAHNQIVSLEPISTLTALTSLNAGCNKVRDTSALAALRLLKVVALHRNDIRRPSAVLTLSALKTLNCLTLANNPVCQHENWQQATIAVLSGLQALDSLVISEADHTAAQPYALTWRQAVDAGDAEYGSNSRISTATATGSAGIGSLNGSRQASSAGRLVAQKPAAARDMGPLTAATGIKDAAAMLPTIAVPSLKPSTLMRKQEQQQTMNPHGWDRNGPVKVVHRQWYGGATSGAAAVEVRSDGTAALQWPDGGMAASLDTEAGMNAAYRLLAMYSSVVGVAASFDSNGGFVQYPNGGLMLVWNKKDGIGTCYGPDGIITHSFNSKKKQLALKQDMKQQLDQHYSIVFKASTYELQLLFECQGCKVGLSSLHGAMLSGGAQPTNKAAMSAIASTSKPDPAVEGSAQGADMREMLARARALMANDFGVTLQPTESSPDDSSPGAADESKAAAPDDMQAMLARARALMAADFDSTPATQSGEATYSDDAPADAAVASEAAPSPAAPDALGDRPEDDMQAILARAKALMAATTAGS